MKYSEKSTENSTLNVLTSDFLHISLQISLHTVFLEERNKIHSSLSKVYFRSHTCIQYVEFIVDTLNQAIRT